MRGGGMCMAEGVAERRPLQRAVRILLECILVSGNVFTAPTPRPMQISIGFCTQFYRSGSRCDTVGQCKLTIREGTKDVARGW